MKEHWTEIEVAGHPCHVYEPPNPSPHGFTIIYLHGIGGESLAAHPRFVEPLAAQGLRLICPITGQSWWSDRISPNFDPEISAEKYVLDHVLPLASSPDPASDSNVVALLGVSMGGQGALRMAYKYPNVFPVAAAIAPAIDFQIRIDEGDPVLRAMYRDAEAARQDTATLHIHPLNWPRHQWFCCDPTDYRWHDSAERLRMKLYSLGVPHECDLDAEAGGHTWQYFETMAVPAAKFIAERLEQERLRVI